MTKVRFTRTKQELKYRDMYLLISITGNDFRRPVYVSKTKKEIVFYLKNKGYYYSKKGNRYIDDKNCGIPGGSGTDYLIKAIEYLPEQ